MQTFALRALGAAAIVWCAGVTPSAQAATITQPFSMTLPFALAPVPNGGEQPLLPNSAFDFTLLPFVGSGLISAQFTYGFAVAGSLTVSPNNIGGSNFSVGAQVAFDGSNFFGTGGGVGNGGFPNDVVPFSFTALSGPIALVGSSVESLLTGTEIIDVTFSNSGASTYVLYADSPGNVASISGTVTLSGSLTYNFEGEGALLSIGVPEPASLAVLGIGLAGLAAGRRRRAA